MKSVKTHIKELFEFDKNQNNIIIGTDEAGRGSGVGAVFASAVCFFDTNESLINKLAKLNDSKKLSRKQREELYDIIKKETINSTIAIDVEEIENINILNASLKAMRLAVTEVSHQINQTDLLVLVDGCHTVPKLTLKQKYVIKGDSKSASIAAASILAKVERDRYMISLAEKYPEYLWDKNMGYLTKDHLNAIDTHGLSPVHRASFLKKHFAKQEQLSLF